MDALRTVLAECADRLGRSSRSRRIGEQNTKAMLIDPVLNALGWDLFDPDEVNREYRRRSHDNPVDYALLLSRTPRMFIEAKGLGENLNDPKWANQTISYAAVAGVDWVVLTDGSEWRVYNAHAPVPIEDKEFRRVSLADDIDAAYEMLGLLSRENIRDNRLRELWDSFHVDRETNRVLVELFAEGQPARDLVNLVHKRVPSLPRSAVTASLQRVRVVFNFPTPALKSGASPEVAPRGRGAVTAEIPEVAPSRRAAAKSVRVTRRVTAEERRLRLDAVIALGRLAPGPIEASYDGRVWPATVDASGTISFGSETFRSLSAAGEAVKIASRGPEVPASVRATDGWGFWRAHDAVTGDTVTLKEIRYRSVGIASDDSGRR